MNLEKIKSFFKDKEAVLTALLFFVAAFLPLIIGTYINSRTIHSLAYEAYPLKRGGYDFFHYYKAITLTVVSFFLVIILISKKSFIKNKEHLLLGFFAFFIFISSVLSPYKSYTMIGGAESYQGVFVWLSYVVLCVAASQLVKVKYFKAVIIGILFSAFYSSLIGFIEYFNSDFHENYLALFLEGKMKFNYANQSPINSLSYNINYYAVFLNIALVINILSFFYVKEKKLEVILFISYVFLFVNFVGTITLAADITYCISLILIIFFLRKQKDRLFRKFGVLIVSTIVLFLFIYNGIGSSHETNASGNRFTISRKSSSLKEIEVKDSILILKRFNAVPLYIKNLNNKNINFSATNDFKQILPISKIGDTVKINSKGFEQIKFLFKNQNKRNIMFLYYDNFFGYKIVIDDKTFKTINPYNNKIEPIINPEKFDFLNRNNSIFSGRGIVWALGIPKLKNTFFTGYGADTFPLAYPNKDYVSKVKLFGTNAPYVASSHSLYLQIALEFGIIGLLCFLLLALVYSLQSVMLLMKESFESFESFLSLACFIAVLGYLIMGVTNSSMLTSSPNFWIVLGLGISVNGVLKNKKEIKS